MVLGYEESCIPSLYLANSVSPCLWLVETSSSLHWKVDASLLRFSDVLQRTQEMPSGVAGLRIASIQYPGLQSQPQIAIQHPLEGENTLLQDRKQISSRTPWDELRPEQS